MPAQWEFQVGPLPAPEVADRIWLARWLLYHIAEDERASATSTPSRSKETGTARAPHGFLHQLEMRNSLESCISVAKAPGRRHGLHVANCGDRIEDRRPNANAEPYVVARLITETVCDAFDGDLQ